MSPEAANGRNVVALGVTKALASVGKTAVFRPSVCRKDTFTDVLLEASNAGLSREQCVGVCPKRARKDKSGSRADIVAAYSEAVESSDPDAMVIVGSDKSAVNDPAMFAFNADVAADLRSVVLLAVCTINRTPEQVRATVEASSKIVEDAGSHVAGVFITGCADAQIEPLKAEFTDYPVKVWTIPAVDFSEDDAIAQADAAFRNNVDASDLIAAIETPFEVPTTPYAFQYGLLGKAKADKKTIVLPEGSEDRIIMAADYLLERDIVDVIIVGERESILARGEELGLKSLEKAKFQSKDDETVLVPMIARLCELRAKKGMTEEQARRQLADDSYFGTMLVVMGQADGLVSGAVNSTANTVRPALQVIKTKPGTSLVSGAFLM
ncbi:MAG TPA: phosphate acetyltransferase, partial [Bifidobacterium sp.]|nr:phosphate acetyltransferase [Bifidobacterium sp.]